MPTASVQAQRFKVLLAGVFSQILCIGIARFAYTPLLPVMQQQSWVSDADGGWLAALNYAGYMLGVVLAASIRTIYLKDTLFRIVSEQRSGDPTNLRCMRVTQPYEIPVDREWSLCHSSDSKKSALFVQHTPKHTKRFAG